ncbi:MAG TPA: sigma-E factor negative regulatory protein [Casimicrobiaceae bacterium]|nr:sigma-E factor negative regulatory protein [Casimicrobiaceae bacterium]
MGKFLAGPDADEPARPTKLMPEEISLLMDGELDADGAERACQGFREVASVQTWVCYHVIGDCLRGDGAPIRGISKRFAARLAAEPTVLAPSRARPTPTAVALAVAATVAAVGVVGWVALATMPLPSSAITTAQRAADVRAADLRRPVVNEYLLAHQEYSPTTAIQGVRPYLRTVTADPQDASK